MITLENRFFPVRSAVCFLVEGGLILSSVILGYLILDRLGGAALLTWEDAFLRGVLVTAICLVAMYFLDLYNIRVNPSPGELFFSIVFSTGIVCIGIGGFTYFFPDLGVGGNLYYVTVALIAIFLFVWRSLYEMYLRRWSPGHNLLILGSGRIIGELELEILEREKMGLRLVGVVGDDQPSESSLRLRSKWLGETYELERIVREQNVRKVVVALTERRGKYPVDSLLGLKVSGIRVIEWPEFLEKLSGRIPIDDLPPSYFIFNEGFRKSRAVLLIRRAISFTISAVALVLLFPLLLLVAVAIKIDSPGPVLYTQDRVGQFGRVFRIIKFRSMRKDAEVNGGPRWAVANDPRITRVGKILRLSRIDELPQLWNVLRGDLDLVGPRPERPQFVEQLQRIIPYYSLRHTIRPGLTGWAQISFMYSGTIEQSKEKLQYDLFYIKNMSLKLDLLILLRTLKIVILGRGAR